MNNHKVVNLYDVSRCISVLICLVINIVVYSNACIFFYTSTLNVKSYLLCLDHVSSFDVMNENTFVDIRWKLFFALVTLDRASCSRPEFK